MNSSDNNNLEQSNNELPAGDPAEPPDHRALGGAKRLVGVLGRRSRGRIAVEASPTRELVARRLAQLGYSK